MAARPTGAGRPVCGRIPIRTNRDDRYLSDKFQALPRDGYTAMFRRMLAHPQHRGAARHRLSATRARRSSYRHLIYTGPIDEYFDHCFGPLPYRSLRFEPETLAQEWFQPAMQVNYPNDHDFTRIVEIKHATGQQTPRDHHRARISRGLTARGQEALLPDPGARRASALRTLRRAAAQEKGVSFVGRLATYRYYNMDQVVGMALAEFEKLRTRLQPA